MMQNGIKEMNYCIFLAPIFLTICAGVVISSVLLFFRLCDDIDISNKNDLANLFANLAGNFENVVQYNKDNRAFEV